MEALNLHKLPQVAQMLCSQYNASESKIVFEWYHNFCDHHTDIAHIITEQTTVEAHDYLYKWTSTVRYISYAYYYSLFNTYNFKFIWKGLQSLQLCFI